MGFIVPLQTAADSSFLGTLEVYDNTTVCKCILLMILVRLEFLPAEFYCWKLGHLGETLKSGG